MGKTMGKTNDRCPLQAECEKKCAYVGRELDCHYYDNNARPGYEIDDQEELRRARWREAEEAELAAMSSYKPERPDRTIETVTVEILDLKREAGEAILDIGARLIEAKGSLPLDAMGSMSPASVSWPGLTGRGGAEDEATKGGTRETDPV